ncbi:hypothetical protein A2U01_0083222, partial [Trifolium medium]|nr:hypothetical protein [Trifolium medium]
GRKKQPAESLPVEKPSKKQKKSKVAKSKSGPGSSSHASQHSPPAPLIPGQPIPLEGRFMSQEAFE